MPNFELYKVSFIGLGLPEEIANLIILRVQELINIDRVIKNIHNVFDEMINRYIAMNL